VNRLETLSVLDRLKVLEGQLNESRMMTRLFQRRLDAPDLTEEEVLGISTNLAIVERDMVGCLNDILLIEQEVGQILC
jgi:hypothetical protein